MTGVFLPVSADIGTAEGCATFIKAVDALGDVAVLVNNMGIFEVRKFEEVRPTRYSGACSLFVCACKCEYVCMCVRMCAHARTHARAVLTC